VSEPAGQVETGEGVIGWQVTEPDGETVATGPQTAVEAATAAGEEP